MMTGPKWVLFSSLLKRDITSLYECLKKNLFEQTALIILNHP